MKVLVFMPLFNDWTSAGRLLQNLDQEFASSKDSPSVLIVDDGSTTAAGPEWTSYNFKKIQTVDVLRLKTNIGHQRALAVGLSYIAEKIACDLVIVMDSDGQDEPSDVIKLIEKSKQVGSGQIVFAQRTRRSESFSFIVGYSMFRIFHYILTGRGINIGNFSAVPASLLPSLVVNPMLWNHYAASIMNSRRPFATLDTRRGVRLDGNSHLNFVSLIIHGLQALACYSDVIGVRIILATSVAAAGTLCALAGILAVRLLTNFAIPGWTSLLAGLLVVLLVQIITLASNFTIQVIGARSLQPFMPARDYFWFVAGFESIFPKK